MLALNRMLFKHNIVCARHRHFYALLWYFGICFGVLAACNVMPESYSSMRTSLCDRVSLPWNLFSALFPYLLYLALRHTWGRMLFATVSCLKAFCYSFSFLLLCRSFGSAGWLISALCLWCEIVATLIFYLFLVGCAGREGSRNALNYCVCVAVTIVIVLVNHYVVIPFWSDLRW